MDVTEHGSRSPRWLGRPRDYQAAALSRYASEHDRVIMPWSYITTDCDVALCLDVECMILNSPQALAYPSGVCTYCGMPAGTRDHLLPAPMTGLALRHIVLTVPACADCNARINDFPSPHVGERRLRAQKSLMKARKWLFDRPYKDACDLRALGPNLRSVAIENNRKADHLRERLTWPDDPFYDIRAFQKSGIDDPVSLGLCNAIAQGIQVPPLVRESA